MYHLLTNSIWSSGMLHLNVLSLEPPSEIPFQPWPPTLLRFFLSVLVLIRSKGSYFSFSVGSIKVFWSNDGWMSTIDTISLVRSYVNTIAWDILILIPTLIIFGVNLSEKNLVVVSWTPTRMPFLYLCCHSAVDNLLALNPRAWHFL